MARLSIDVEITGVKNAQGQLEDLKVIGEETEKVFKRISGTSGFSKLAGQIKAVEKLAFSISNEYAQLNDRLDDLRNNKTHSFLLGETKKQIKGVKELDKAYEEHIGLVNEKNLLSGKDLDSVQRETKQLKLQNKILKDQLKAQQRLVHERTKGTREYSQAEARAAAKREKDQIEYWLAERRYQKRAALEAARLRKKQERQRLESAKKLRQYLGAVSAGLGFGFAAGGAAGAVLAGINVLTRAVEGLARAWVRMSQAASRSFVQINTEMEQLKILLNTATGSTAGGTAAFNDIIQFAETAPFSIQALTDSYVKLKVSGLDPMDGSLRTLTDSVAAFGGNSEQLKLVTIAIQQMVGKGVVSMEELRRQFGEQVPTAIRAMARGLDMSILDLFKKIETGTLDATTAINAMLPELDKLHGGASQKRMESMSGAVTKMKNAWIALMLEIGQSGDLWKNMTEFVKDASDALTEFKNSYEGEKLFKQISQEINNIMFRFKENPEIFSEIFSSGVKLFKQSVKLVDALSKKVYSIYDFLFNAGIAEKFVVIVTSAFETLIMSVSSIGPGLLRALNLDFVADGFEKVRDKVADGFQWIRDLMKKNRIKGEDIIDIDNIDYDLGIVHDSFKTAIEQLEEMDQKNFKNFEKEIESLASEILKLEEDITGLNKSFRSILNQNLAEERQIALELGIDFDGPSLSEQIRAIGNQIDEINLNQAGGYEKALGLLKQQRDLIKEMKGEAKAVTKEQVKAAKESFEYYSHISKGGTIAGTREEYVRLRQEYGRLSVLQKEGKADTRQQKEIEKEKLGLLKENTRKLEEIHNAEIGRLKEKQENLEQERKTKELMAENEITSLQEVREIEKQIHFQWIQDNQEKIFGLKQREQAARNAAAAEASGGGNNYYNPQSEPSNRYAGGPVDAHSPYIVGERGPELFVPSQNGRIIPNNEITGETMSLEFNFNGNRAGTLTGSRDVAMEVLRQFERMQGALS